MLRGSVTILLDFEDAAPLGKVAAVLLVLGAALGEAVQALGGALVQAAGQWDNTLVDLNGKVSFCEI